MAKIQSSPSTLAFVGDAYYGLLVRKMLSATERPIGELHSLSVKYVNATAQAESYKKIESMLTEEELSAYKRGRNLHTANTPKNATVAEYHSATGLEALFGYLYLSGDTARAEQLFSVIIG